MPESTPAIRAKLLAALKRAKANEQLVSLVARKKPPLPTEKPAIKPKRLPGLPSRPDEPMPNHPDVEVPGKPLRVRPPKPYEPAAVKRTNRK